MTMFFVRPVAPVVVDPATGEPLPYTGAWVARSQYWLRRIAAGDVEKVEERI